MVEEKIKKKLTLTISNKKTNLVPQVILQVVTRNQLL